MFSQSDHEEKKNLLLSIPSCLGFFRLPAARQALDTVQKGIQGKSNAGYILQRICEGKGDS